MTALTPERLAKIEQDALKATWIVGITQADAIELIAAARANAKLVEALKQARDFADARRDDRDLYESEAAQFMFQLIECALEAAGVKP